MAAALAVALAALLAIVGCLEPDPRGFGTHTQLGLRPCAFRLRTGRPCPACGMTTALAWAVRGRLDRSWQANPAGCLLGPLGALLIPWLVFATATGRTLGSRTLDGPLIVLAVATVALGLAAWSLKLYLGRV